MRHRLSAVTLLSLALVPATGGMASPSSRDALAGPLEVRNVSPAATRTIEFETTEVTQPHIALSPDGQWLIFTMLGHLFRLPVEGGTAEQLTFGPYYASDPAFSPDGTQVAFVSDRDGGEDNVFVLELATSRITQVTRKSHAQSIRLTWTPDGQAIVYLPFTGAPGGSTNLSPALVRRVSLDGGEPETLSAPARLFRSVFYLQDGRLAWTMVEREGPSSPHTTRIEVMSPEGVVSTVRTMSGYADRAVPSPAGDGLYWRHREPGLAGGTDFGGEKPVVRATPRGRRATNYPLVAPLLFQ